MHQRLSVPDEAQVRALKGADLAVAVLALDATWRGSLTGRALEEASSLLE